MLFWARKGFPDLGDKGGSGIGTTTTFVLRRENFKKEPHEVSTSQRKHVINLYLLLFNVFQPKVP